LLCFLQLRLNIFAQPKASGGLIEPISSVAQLLKSLCKRICIGVAATLAWQSYSEATKQMIATSALELGWSPGAKQMIASWVQQSGWTKLEAGPESSAVQPSVSETQVATAAQTVPIPKAPAAPSIDPEQAHQIALDLGALRQTVDQLAARQDQMEHDISKLQAVDMEILAQNPSALAQPPATPARNPTSIAPVTSPITVHEDRLNVCWPFARVSLNQRNTLYAVESA
jgi:hypothetical protein